MPLPTFVTHLFSTVKNQLLETDSSKAFNDHATDEILFKLYNKVALYYDDPAINFTNEYLSALYEQLDILFEKLSAWGAIHALPTLVLDTFLKRLKTEKKGKLQEVFFNRGKRLLERLVVSLAKEEIPLDHKKRVLSTLLANDGLEQCVDNCQLMFEHAVNSLDHLSNMKLYFSGLIDVASSEDILLPQSFQRILCSLNHLPYAAYGEIAKNYFLLYAKEAGFPINVLQDVNALRLQSQLDRKQLNYEQLHHDFLDMLKNRFQLGELIDHVSVNYHKKINKILSNDYPYQYKLDLIVALLNLIGQDNDFTLHHILNEKGLFAVISGVKLTVIKRFIQHNYLPISIRCESV
ncbi:hypothetical protein [Rickettsiella massiliensis]|uniref:hypothetical protein n=1 Tax=Rickettsiella massiliensis TaxID=676517 RepID=UPI00029A8FA9|nr:hypothetical protein [Rickettsiella massiliensis]